MLSMEELLKAVEEDNDEDAMFEIGCKYKYGWDIEKNYEEAVYYLSLAAELGNKSAQFELGGLYELGLGVPKDMDKARELYAMSKEEDEN